MQLLDIASKKHLNPKQNQARNLRLTEDISSGKSIELSYSLTDFKDKEKQSPITSWHNISTLTLFLKDLETGKDLDLSLPQNADYIELIHWTE